MDRAFRVAVGSHPIDQEGVSVACMEGVEVGRHVAYLALGDKANTAGTWGWLAKSRDL